MYSKKKKRKRICVIHYDSSITSNHKIFHRWIFAVILLMESATWRAWNPKIFLFSPHQPMVTLRWCPTVKQSPLPNFSFILPDKVYSYCLKLFRWRPHSVEKTKHSTSWKFDLHPLSLMDSSFRPGLRLLYMYGMLYAVQILFVGCIALLLSCFFVSFKTACRLS